MAIVWRLCLLAYCPRATSMASRTCSCNQETLSTMAATALVTSEPTACDLGDKVFDIGGNIGVTAVTTLST